MSSRPIQYLLVGFPYSGKTALGKALEKRPDFVHINLDQLKFDRGYTNSGDDEVPDTVWEEIFEEADRLLMKYLTEGKNVVNEYAWITKKWRDRARIAAKKAGSETKVIYLKIPPEEIRKRRAENSQTQARFQWPEEEFDRMFEDFEEPEANEGVIYYNGTEAINDWIIKNIP